MPTSRRPRLPVVLVTLLLSAAGLLAGPAPAEAAGSAVTGTVTYLTPSAAVPNGTVTLYQPYVLTTPVAGVSTVLVGSGGSYSLSNVPNGSYWLYATTLQDGVQYSSITAVTVSGATSKDLHLLPRFSCPIQLSGRMNVGQDLTSAVTVSPSESYQTVSRQWLRYTMAPDGSVASAEQLPDTAPTRTVVEADLGHKLDLQTLLWNAGNGRIGQCGTDWQHASLVGPRLPALDAAPSVSGTHKVGKTLAAAVPLESGTVATYQWFRVVRKKHHHVVTQPIPGATGATYRLKRKDGDMKVFVEVTGSGGAYAVSVQDSVPVKVHR